MNNTLLYQFSAANFAVWELHLYLDTHPNDEKAKSLLREYSIKAEKLKSEYENMYGPLTPSCASGESWIKNPWPWQNNRSCAGDN